MKYWKPFSLPLMLPTPLYCVLNLFSCMWPWFDPKDLFVSLTCYSLTPFKAFGESLSKRKYFKKYIKEISFSSREANKIKPVQEESMKWTCKESQPNWFSTCHQNSYFHILQPAPVTCVRKSIHDWWCLWIFGKQLNRCIQSMKKSHTNLKQPTTD